MLTQKTHKLSRHKGYKKQGGIAFLVLVIVIFLAISTYYLTSVSIVELQVDKIESTQLVLKRAKQALLDYARVNWRMLDADGDSQAGKIGKLPCPDYKLTVINEGEPDEKKIDGEQDGNCGNAYANAIGYFPWRTLGIDITKDSSGSCLLYAVSPAYKNSPAAALSPDSFGQFRIVDNAGEIVQGVLPEDRPVAVIIAPEATLPGQERENDPARICGSYYSDDEPNLVTDLVAAYLDNDGTTNNAAIDPKTNNVRENFVATYTGSDEADNPLNDRLITITYREFWDAMQSAVTSTTFHDRMENLTEAIALCFAEYGDKNGQHLPMPAEVNLNGGEYRRSSDYDDSGDFTANYFGRLPYSVEKANAVLGGPNVNNIFSNAYCNALELTTTTGEDNINFTDDAGDDQGEFFDLWTNWKDHFFYAVSKAHKPDATVAACSGDCVKANSIEYAAIVFFSGQKITTDSSYEQKRYAPPFDGSLAVDATDDKDDMINYLENTNAGEYPDNSGNGSYNIVGGSSNDIMFCIRPDMTVSQCL